MVRSLIAFALLAAGLPARGEDKKLPGPAITFPDVKDFTHTEPRVYPQSELGYSVGYNAPGVTITVFVYNFGQKEIPDGPESKLVQEQMDSAIRDIETARKQGSYKSALKGSTDVVPIAKGVPEMARTRFMVESAKGLKRQSDIYITGYKNHFVKLRISYDEEDRKANEAKVEEFLKALGGALK